MKLNIRTSNGSIKLNPLILAIPLTLALIMLATQAAETDSSTTVMNATVSNVVSVNISAALTRGILYGSVTANTNNNMAENDTTGTGNVTEYFVGNGPTSTGNLNLWDKAADMTRGATVADTIIIANVTYEGNKTTPDNSSNVNMTNIADGQVTMTTTYSQMADGNCTSVASGGVCWLAYWLDVPANIPDGTYNTTYNYCGNLTFGNTAC